MDGQAPVTSNPIRRISSFGLKLAVSAGLVALVLDQIDFDQVLQIGQGIRPEALVIAMSLVFLQVPFLSSRWQLVARRLGSNLGGVDALRLTWVGLFFNNFLPGAVGGDLARAWLLLRFRLNWQESIASVFIDRASALVVVLALAAGNLPYLASLQIPSHLLVWFMLTLLVSALVLLTIVLAAHTKSPALTRFAPIMFVATVVRLGVHAISSRMVMLRLTVNALAVHGITILAVFVIAQGVGANVSFAEVFAVVPAVMLILTIPISLAGWGMREGAMVLLLGMLGTPAPEAVTISIAWGLAVLISSIPGLGFWLALRRLSSGSD
jgi:uncharacterized membrane protein YbhN (UPF0104 family)